MTDDCRYRVECRNHRNFCKSFVFGMYKYRVILYDYGISHGRSALLNLIIYESLWELKDYEHILEKMLGEFWSCGSIFPGRVLITVAVSMVELYTPINNSYQ